MASLHKAQRDFAKALDICEKSLDIQLASLPVRHPDVRNIFNSKRIVYFIKLKSTPRKLYSSTKSLWLFDWQPLGEAVSYEYQKSYYDLKQSVLRHSKALDVSGMMCMINKFFVCIIGDRGELLRDAKKFESKLEETT